MGFISVFKGLILATYTLDCAKLGILVKWQPVTFDHIFYEIGIFLWYYTGYLHNNLVTRLSRILASDSQLLSTTFYV